MTTPREEYESALDRAFVEHDHDLKDSNRELVQAMTDAWYNYQVRTGMLPVPEPERQADNDGQQGDGTEAGTEGDSDPVREDSGEASGPESGTDAGS